MLKPQTFLLVFCFWVLLFCVQNFVLSAAELMCFIYFYKIYYKRNSFPAETIKYAMLPKILNLVNCYKLKENTVFSPRLLVSCRNHRRDFTSENWNFSFKKEMLKAKWFIVFWSSFRPIIISGWQKKVFQ